MYAAGKRIPLCETCVQPRHELYRVPDNDPVQCVPNTHGKRTLEVVDIPPAKKLGGSHSTPISGRQSRRTIGVVTGHPHVKKVISSPIDADDTGSWVGPRTKITRADGNGNIRLLPRDGSSVQEDRIIMTVMNRETGKRVRDDLNEALREDRFRDEQVGGCAETGIEWAT